MTGAPAPASACFACGAAGPRELPAFRHMPRVTSDCRPWPKGGRVACCAACGTIQKPADAEWEADVAGVYATYDIYAYSGGAEPQIFQGDGASVARSHAVVRHVLGQGAFPPVGRMLDIGCGNGAALASFGQALPGWALHGVELSDRNLARLESIPGFAGLCRSVEQAAAKGPFHIVSLIHSLEHMPAPRQALADALALLAPGGTLLVQIPNLETSPFDLLVADHRAHFTPATLDFLARRAGLRVDSLSASVLPKEMSLLGGPGGTGEATLPDPAALPDPALGADLLERTFRWLADVLDTAARIPAPFGIFGSSISAAWLDGALGEKIGFFVDEDSSRWGWSINGRPILAPQQVAPGERVYVPLVPPIAAKVVARLAGLPIHLVAPPPFSKS